ncbi:MAG: hypothetical protein AAFY88_06200, partial [Acidobacteriota bacterium]
MRQYAPFVLVILVLSILAGVAWLSHHPHSAAVRWGEWLPVVGPYLTEFRRAHMPRKEPVRVTPSAPKPLRLVDFPKVDTRPPWTGEPEHLWVLDGTQIVSAPRPGATPTWRLDAITHLALLGRRGDWFRVWHHGREGWVHLPDYDEDAPPLGSEPDPVLPLVPREPDPDRLARALALLGDEVQEFKWAGYRVYTDVWDADLLARMARVLLSLEPVYRERYGVELLGPIRGAVVIYQRQEDLEELQHAEGLAGLPATGHAAGGVAALGVGSRPKHEVISTLIHEVAHLMHRRALGPALPPWLDEGLSDELANLYVAADGTLSAAGWSGKRVEEFDRVTYEGAPASLRVSVRTVHSGQSPPLPRLLSYDWRQFVVSSDSRLHYDLSAFFLRFLLDEPRRAAALRTFLGATAKGEPI